jgi:hypothetical protein
VLLRRPERRTIGPDNQHALCYGERCRSGVLHANAQVTLTLCDRIDTVLPDAFAQNRMLRRRRTPQFDGSYVRSRSSCQGVADKHVL